MISPMGLESIGCASVGLIQIGIILTACNLAAAWWNWRRRKANQWMEDYLLAQRALIRAQAMEEAKAEAEKRIKKALMEIRALE